ncbi:MAG: C10 family peptidase, partial [Sedimentisphaerales bacterium]|nr:C10 family peptidase [Sedimentisphaerales bacterium]
GFCRYIEGGLFLFSCRGIFYLQRKVRFYGAVKKIVRTKTILIFLSVLLLLLCGNSPARPTTENQAQKVAEGWLRAAALPFFSDTDCSVVNIETYTDYAGEPVYYVAYLQPGGFLVVSADDTVEPIIAFSESGGFEPSDDNPLASLAAKDIGDRIICAGQTFSLQSTTTLSTRSKWNFFISLGGKNEAGLSLMSLSSLSDIRVPPLTKSRWGQSNCCTDPAVNCYNYYTPGRYPSGCVSIAMAQLMRYYRYPAFGIGINRFEIEVDGTFDTALTRGGDGYGGQYDFAAMAFEPNCVTTESQRQAIGGLCYDSGISVGTIYMPDSSFAAIEKAKDALVSTFRFGNAVSGYNGSENIGPGLTGMINPNLDAGSPVILGINRSNGGHAVLCDGYGYIASTLYYHLNMGWSGGSDAWYNLPEVVTNNHEYDSITECIYNIRTTKVGDGEAISGRVFDYYGKQLTDANVFAESINGGGSFSRLTDEKGIYAFDGLNSNTSYTIRPQAGAFIFAGRIVTTGNSEDNRAVSGNIWGVDFAASHTGDFDGDGNIDSADFAVFASAWQSTPDDLRWNPDCDISNPADNIINSLDLAVFVDNWLATAE